MAMETPLDKLKRIIEKYESCPSLQRLAMTSCVISLWSKPEIQNKIIHYFVTVLRRTVVKTTPEWKEIESEIAAQAQTIPSHVFKEELESAMLNVNAQMCDWLEYLKKYTCCDENAQKNYITDIAWTDSGTVDKEKTFYLLMKYDSLKTNGSLYNLAHNLLLTEEIPALWSQLPGDLQRRFETKQKILGHMDITFVTLYRKIEHKDTLPLNEVIASHLFDCIMINGHEAALKRIWECQSLHQKSAMEVHACHWIWVTLFANPLMRYRLYFLVHRGLDKNFDTLEMDLGSASEVALAREFISFYDCEVGRY